MTLQQTADHPLRTVPVCLVFFIDLPASHNVERSFFLSRKQTLSLFYILLSPVLLRSDVILEIQSQKRNKAVCCCSTHVANICSLYLALTEGPCQREP